MTAPSMPKYQRVASDLRASIDKGVYRPGDQLPTREQLAEQHDVSIGTIVAALRVLRDEGYVETAQGAGIFALRPERRAVPEWFEPYREQIEELRRWRDETQPPRSPEPQPIAMAIVTSGQSVLITKRRDGIPPYGFPAGEVEPGEDAPHAAVREVKEECALEVRAGREIGRRIHPRTGRTVIYIACRVHQFRTEVINGDEAELEAVIWLSLDTTLHVMPDIFEPVADYLRKTLKPS